MKDKATYVAQTESLNEGKAQQIKTFSVFIKRKNTYISSSYHSHSTTAQQSNNMSSSIQKNDPMIRLFQIFSAKLVLEVFGGAGAIWGFSEALTLRTPDTVWFWRPCALFIGFIFFIRWTKQIQDYLDEVYTGNSVERLNAMVRLVQIFSAKLVLEVFGGAGAIWGFSEAVTLRTPDTIWFWRPCALIFGVIFFVRWMMQIQDYLVEMKYNETLDRLNANASEKEELCNTVTNSDEEMSESGLIYNSIGAM